MEINSAFNSVNSLSSVFNADTKTVIDRANQEQKPPVPQPKQSDTGSQQQASQNNQQLQQQRQSAQQELASLNQNVTPENTTTNQSAISAYSSVQNQAKREEFQSLLGVDTYV